MGEMRNVHKIMFRKPEGRRPLGRPIRRWEGDIKMDHRDIGWEVVNWIHLAQDRDQWRTLVTTVINLWIPQKAGNFLTSSAIISFSGRTLLHGVY
jgi:hypothetical protein